ncbi:MAG: 1-acyl-sn-glycerol-3-phosphate acyltransferase [Gammaproteobacteria bacterium]|nr:1-acyl-sn-glycerol-3-phosphate acyltransferase [Gammaproteobacteria bacterium]
MFLFFKKSYRFIRIILHVLWGIIQVVYHLNEVDSLSEKEKKIVLNWFDKFVQLLNIEKKIHGEIHPENQLMVANHISWKDILLLNSIYPTRFVAMSEISKWPIVGWLSTKVGTLFVKRGNISDIRRLNEQIYNLIAAGERVTLFPEGATSDGSEIAHLYPGLFQSVISSSENDIPLGVQPIVIVYKVDDSLSPHIPFTGKGSMLGNLWTVLGFDHITADIYFTSYISSENMTRKTLSKNSLQQMREILSVKI